MFLISRLKLRPGASDEAINNLQDEFGVQFPEDYINFLKLSNGAHGFVGNAYLILDPVEDIPERNKVLAIDEFAPGLLLFGSDGGGEGYFFDIRSSQINIVEVPFEVIGLSAIKKIGVTLLDLLEYKYNQYSAP